MLAQSTLERKMISRGDSRNFRWSAQVNAAVSRSQPSTAYLKGRENVCTSGVDENIAITTLLLLQMDL